LRFGVDKVVLGQILFFYEGLDFSLSASFQQCFMQKTHYIKSAIIIIIIIIINKNKEPKHQTPPSMK
jgi:hypothetical protein